MTRRLIYFCSQTFAYLTLLAVVLATGSNAAGSESTDQSAPPGAALQSDALTNAEQVHWLSRNEAASGRRVLIRGVITCALPAFEAAVVQDATAGIYIDRWNALLGAPPQLGELVEVEGFTEPGEFAPRVHAVRINRLGTAGLPPPAHPYWDQLINGSLDTEFVEIEGIITMIRADGVMLLTHGGKINVLLFDENGRTNAVAFKPYDGALVRLRGCLFASWDAATHQVDVRSIRMYAPSVKVVEPAPADAFAVMPKRVADLLQFDPQASALRQVKVSGQIVQERDGEYFAMDGTNGFRFTTKEAVNLQNGDMVEVVGFPSLTGPSPVLREALARKVGVASVPDSRPLNTDNLFRAENDAVRVYVEAVLLNLSEDRRTLELQTGLQRFVARINAGGGSDPRNPGQFKGIDLPLGSRLGLTGIYAGNGRNTTTGTDIANFELLLDSPADIRVLARPPFWTLQRLLILVGALLGVLGWALVWIRLLHHQIQQRTAQLQKEVHVRELAEQQRTLAQERARIARDLHDDLGSSLTEISMLATAGPGSGLPPREAAERMETIAGKSRTLVNALDEIVWAVDPERDTLASVIRYLASHAEEYLTGLKIACRVQIPNSFPDCVISGEVRHHLFLTVKEALNNAVRHGAASEIGFHVQLKDDQLRISITDNGSGFNTDGHTNGYGLVNLQERIGRLHGRCELESAPGAGTTVRLQMPLSAHNPTP